MTSIARFGACIAAAALIAGCGGSSSSSDTSSSSSTTSTTPTAMPAATTASQMAGGAPMAAPAAVPASLHCTDAIVWVNTTKKSYHLSGDPYYGRTKHGEYMCQATADGQGYHLAGTPHRHTGTQTTDGTTEPSPAST